MTRRDIRDRIFKIVFTLEFNDAEGMQDQLDFAFDPEMPAQNSKVNANRIRLGTSTVK